MTHEQVKVFRKRQIERLAQLGGGDVQRANARSLYNRCVRFCLRYARWNVDHCNGGMTASQRKTHEHEGELLASIESRMNDELRHYGLKWDHNGIYPGLVNESGNVEIELFWY